MALKKRAAPDDGIDPDTGVLDADGFMEAIGADAVQQALHDREAGIVTITLTDLNSVIRTYGAEVGRALTGAVASRLHRVTRGGDMLGRTTRDTFRILVMDPDPVTAMKVISARASELLGETIWHHQRAVQVRSSVESSVPGGHGAAVALLERDKTSEMASQSAAARRAAMKLEADRQLAMRARLAAHSAGKKAG